MRVLVATDGSSSAGLGVDLVAGVAWPEGSTIRVVESIETGGALFGGPWPAAALVQADELEAALRQAAGEVVDGARSRLTRPGIDVVEEVIQGRPATAIVEAAKAFGADLIVVGSRGHGAIGSMLLGSVSSEIVDQASVPVLVARGPSVERVLLAWDGSAGAQTAAELLQAWPMFARSSVRVVSVADVEIPWWTGFPVGGSPELSAAYADGASASRAAHDELARAMTAQLQQAGLEAEAERRDGDAATELLAAANDWAADVILMGTQGRTGLARLALGSVARNVVHHAGCSVLVARGPQPAA